MFADIVDIIIAVVVILILGDIQETLLRFWVAGAKLSDYLETKPILRNY